MDERIRRSRVFPAGMKHASQAIQWMVKSALELSAGEIRHDWLHLALEEAVTNICRHAYRSNPDATYHVSIWRDGENLVVELTDQGAPFDPLTAPVAAERCFTNTSGGLGLPLLRACINNPSYVRQDSMNILRFCVPIVSRSWSSIGGNPHVQ